MKTDEELIEKIKDGNIAAFEEIITRYKAKIYKIIFSIIRDPQDAEDLVQEVFIKVYNSIRKFRGRSRFYTWLYRITVNVALNYLRKNKKNLEFIDDIGFSLKEREIEEHIYTQEIVKEIFDLANALPKKEKLIFILKFQNGLSNKEISEVLGLSRDSVKANLYHALKKMRKSLREKGFLGD